MTVDPKRILSVLDACSEAFTFPMLDNGYVYLAATRLSLYRSSSDWAMVIEVFGFSPRAGAPDTCICTFASRLHNRDLPEKYADSKAYENYLRNNPNNESRFVYPVSDDAWQDSENRELVVANAHELMVRGQSLELPPPDMYANHGIELEMAPRVQTFELCRYLADIARDKVLATPEERRASVLPEMEQILQLEEWHHPNIVANDLPSGSETFQQLAQVLATGDRGFYRPSQSSNTHWRNWPEGGLL